MIVLNDYRKYPQAHRIIVVAFHLEVFRDYYLNFPKGRHSVKDFSRDMDKIM